MYQLLDNFVNYTGSGYNYESYLIYASLVIAILLVVFVLDLLYRLFRHFWR